MTLLTGAASDPSIIQTVLIGMGTVFAGIALIILICKLLSLISLKKEKPSETPADPVPEDGAISGELAAVIGAAIAEDLGKDVSAIRIISIKKING